MNQIMKFECADRSGLIHAITGRIRTAGLNILRTDEFVGDGRFFMRCEVEGGPADPEAFSADLRKVLPEDARIEVIDGTRRKTVLLLATREWHCLGDLLLRHHFGELPMTVQAVASNRDDLAGLAGRFGIPFELITPARTDASPDAPDDLEHLVERYRPDLVILAKYMRIVRPRCVARLRNRILNVHHSFLPAFAGANPYRQAWERGVKLIGATAHFVTDVLDDGPIIVQDVEPVGHGDTVEDLKAVGRDIEVRVLARALKLVLEDRVFVMGNRTVVFQN